MSNKSIDWRAARSQMRNSRVERPDIREQRLNPIRDPRAPGGTRYLMTSWRGLSAKNYIFALIDFSAEPLIYDAPCVVLACSRNAQAVASIIEVRANIHPDEAEGWVQRMREAGATELHRCVAGGTGPDGLLTARERMAAALDLTAELPPAPARAA